MACLDLNFSHPSFDEPFILRLEESISDEILGVPEASTSSLCRSSNVPKPPSFPGGTHVRTSFSRRLSGYSHVPKETKDAWDQIFKEGYEADVHFLTDEKEVVLAHSCVLVSIL